MKNIKIAIFLGFMFVTQWLNAEALSIENFFPEKGLATVEMSPSGKWLALLSFSGEEQEIAIKSIDLKESIKLLDTKTFDTQDSTISDLFWLDDDHLAVQYTLIREGTYRLNDTKVKFELLIVKIPKNNAKLIATDSKNLEVKSVRSSGRLVNPLVEEPGVFLFSKPGASSKIYRLEIDKLNNYGEPLNKLTRIDGGQFVPANEVISASGFAIRWFFKKSEPAAVLTVTTDSKLAISTVKENNELSIVHAWSEKNATDDKLFLPIAITKNKNEFFCLDLNEDIEKSVYLVNFETQEHKLFYQTDSYQILDFVTDPDQDEYYGVKVLRNGIIDFEYFDDDSLNTRNTESSELNLVINVKGDGRHEVGYRVTHEEPPHYFIYDKTTKKQTFLGSRFPDLVGKTKNTLVEGTVSVDGLEIPYFLNMPKGKNRYPLVVYPHGGPFGVHDDRYFNSHVQYLVDEGYAVLRVNYRGSSGYSQEFEEAGVGHWGDGILKDIIEATRVAMQNPQVDAEKSCIIGFSYGGYAASKLVIDYPDLFNCAVSVSGVSDLNLHLNAHFLRRGTVDWYREQVGDSLKDYDSLKAISPLYSLEHLTKPIYLMHGAEDVTVDVEQTYRMKAMLEHLQKPYEIKIYPKANHHFVDKDDLIDVMREMSRFLSENISG
ncbi:S9 family peptidase [Sessilibacter sp. MAH1]